MAMDLTKLLGDGLAQAQDRVIHHSANVAAVVIPAMSHALHGPETLTYVTAGLGVVWYTILIVERVCYWLQRWSNDLKSRARRPAQVEKDRANAAGQMQYDRTVADAQATQKASSQAAQVAYDKAPKV